MVTADVNDKVITSLEANHALQEKFKDIAARYPGVDVIYGGEHERTQESLARPNWCSLTGMIRSRDSGFDGADIPCGVGVVVRAAR